MTNADPPSRASDRRQLQKPKGEHQSTRRRVHEGSALGRMPQLRHVGLLPPGILCRCYRGSSCGLHDRRSAALRTRAHGPRRVPSKEDVSSRRQRADVPRASESKRMYQPRPLRRFRFCTRGFTPSWDVPRVRLATDKSAKTPGSRIAYKGFEAQPDGLSVGCRSTRGFGLLKQGVVDVERLLHMYNYAIQVWRRRWRSREPVLKAFAIRQPRVRWRASAGNIPDRRRSASSSGE